MLNRLFICCVVLFGALQLGFSEVSAEEERSSWMFYCRDTKDEKEKEDCWVQSMIVGTKSAGDEGAVDGKVYFQLHNSGNPWILRLFFTEKHVDEILLFGNNDGKRALVIGRMIVIAVEDKGTWADLVLTEPEARWLANHESLGLHWTTTGADKDTGFGYFNIMSMRGFGDAIAEHVKWHASFAKKD